MDGSRVMSRVRSPVRRVLRGVRKGVSLSLAAVGLGVRRGLATLVTSGHVEKCATRGTLGGRERVRLALVRGEDGGRSRVRSSLSDVVIRGGGGVSRGVSSGLATLAAVRFGRERLDEARRGVSLALAAVGGLSRGAFRVGAKGLAFARCCQFRCGANVAKWQGLDAAYRMLGSGYGGRWTSVGDLRSRT